MTVHDPAVASAEESDAQQDEEAEEHFDDENLVGAPSAHAVGRDLDGITLQTKGEA